VNRSMARRYAPLAGLIAIQVLIVALAPSKAPDVQEQFTATGQGNVPGLGQGKGGAVLDEETGQYVDPETGDIVSGAGGAGESGTTGGDATATGQSAGADAGGGEGAAAGEGDGGLTGDTSHCRNGRQFDLYFAPPCVPKWAGGDNGGSTYQGVTAEKVTIVRYNAQSDPAVDALLASQDLAASNDQEEAFQTAAEKFINANYQRWGRQVDLVTFDGTCDLLPPDYPCLRNDMRKLVSQHKPFAVFWNTPLASAAFDELSALQVINAGGWHFDEDFHNQRRPFHWDGSMSGSKVAKHVAEYWCERMAGKPAQYAGDPQLQVKTRRLGVISPDDDANRRVVDEFKKLVASCGGGVKADYFYAQDIDRANEQRKAAVARMQAADVTTVVCMCGGIASYFLVITCDEDRFYPEHLLPGTGGGVSLGMDSDAIGRLYQKSTQMDQFWGVSGLPNSEPWNGNDAARVWKAAGNGGDPPYRTAIGDWRYLEFFAGAIQMAGPNLNPLTFEQGAFRMGRPTDGPMHETRVYRQGDYTGVDDAREVYWSSTAISKFDGKAGAWVALNGGKRYQIGQWPATEPELPATRG